MSANWSVTKDMRTRFEEQNPVRRTIHPEVRVLDEKKGLVEYVASDESLDSYREVIRANGWRFDYFKKNAPVPDSHDYSTVEKLLGKVTDFEVRSRKLVETVQFAIDVPENKLAQLAWAMTKAGYLKAVSVGFVPEKMVTKWDQDKAAWMDEVKNLGYDDKTGPRVVYLQQQQIELSLCVIGANPNALAKSYKDGVINEGDLEFLSQEYGRCENAKAADELAVAAMARQRARRNQFLESFAKAVDRI
jgi:hypothetical protein